MLNRFRNLLGLTLVGLFFMLGAPTWAGEPLRLIEGSDYVSGKIQRFDLTKENNVVVFLSAKCPCSVSHEDELKALAGRFKTIPFVGIHSNVDEDPGLGMQHFSKFPFPVLRDSGAMFANAFGALKTPHVFVLGKNGETLFSGGVDESRDQKNAKNHYLRDALAAISEGKSPKIKTARTLGCVIRR